MKWQRTEFRIGGRGGWYDLLDFCRGESDQYAKPV